MKETASITNSFHNFLIFDGQFVQGKIGFFSRSVEDLFLPNSIESLIITRITSKQI